MTCSNSTTVLFGHSALHISSRSTTSPGNSSSMPRIRMGCSRVEMHRHHTGAARRHPDQARIEDILLNPINHPDAPEVLLPYGGGATRNTTSPAQWGVQKNTCKQTRFCCHLHVS